MSDVLKERDVGHKWVSGTGGREKNGEQSRTVASYSKQPQSYMIVLLHVHACNNHKTTCITTRLETRWLMSQPTSIDVL